MEDTRILHYEILRLLGRGGMGEVYEARDTKLQRRVALKFIAPELSADVASARRFEREALSAAALSHPHIATLYALEHDGRAVFIAMELITGGSLRERMAGGPLPVPEALAIAREVAAALAHAHRRGIAHRDIKPENLMFDEEGAVKVMDFGLAHAVQASRLTLTGSTLGTAAYMAPESTRGAVGAPADVFALGVVLYEMLAGALPFPGENPLAQLYMVANEEPRPLRGVRSEVAPEVEAAVARLLIKDPEQRPDAAAAARELSALTGVAPPAAEPAPTPVDVAVTTGRRTEEMEVERLPARSDERALVPAGAPRRGRRLVLLGGLVLLAIGAVLGLRWVSSRGAAGSERALQSRVLSDEAAGLILRGSADSAQALADSALALDPGNARARFNLGQALRLQGQATRAAAMFTRTLNEAKRDPKLQAMACLGLADLAMDDGTWREAVRDLQRSFALDSNDYTCAQLGFALVRDGRPAEALPLLRRGLATWPGSAPLHKNAAFALYRLDSLAAALREVDQALAARPDFPAALGLRARVRARLGDPARALADWDAFLRSRPGPADSAEVEGELRTAGALR
jgi:tetratricopeptide (TPR) repeat protein/tRNA A-37 threonylcarbamoyl transferase component Bud32